MLADFEEREETFPGIARGLVRLTLLENGMACLNTFITDICPGVVTRGRNQRSDYFLAFAAERTD